MPAIIDMNRLTAVSQSVFESGRFCCINEKTSKFIPTAVRGRKTVNEWLFWQMGGLGPMAGQNHHFGQYAPIPTQLTATCGTNQLYGVLDRRLQEHKYLAVIIRLLMAWLFPERQQQKLLDFPNLKRWFESIRERPAVKPCLRRRASHSPCSCD